MKNEELIKTLRWCGSDDDDNEYCVDANYSCPYFKWDKQKDYCKQELMRDAADALEAAENSIAELEKRTKLPERQEFLAKGSFVKEPLSRPKEGEWIPCSERMPELGQEVLVYAIGKDDGFIGDAVTTISERFIFRLFPSSDGVEEWRSPWEYFDSNYEITHWMPLPEPPKGEQE